MEYVVGQELACSAIVSSVEEDGITIEIKEIPDFDYLHLTQEEMNEAFDPEFRKKRLLAEKERIENELKQLEESN